MEVCWFVYCEKQLVSNFSEKHEFAPRSSQFYWFIVAENICLFCCWSFLNDNFEKLSKYIKLTVKGLEKHILLWTILKIHSEFRLCIWNCTLRNNMIFNKKILSSQTFALLEKLQLAPRGSNHFIFSTLLDRRIYCIIHMFFDTNLVQKKIKMKLARTDRPRIKRNIRGRWPFLQELTGQSYRWSRHREEVKFLQKSKVRPLSRAKNIPARLGVFYVAAGEAGKGI